MNPDEGIKTGYTHKPDMAHKQHGTKRLRGQDKDPSLWILVLPLTTIICL
jgi:hypothetical protein